MFSILDLGAGTITDIKLGIVTLVLFGFFGSFILWRINKCGKLMDKLESDRKKGNIHSMDTIDIYE